MTNKKQTFLLTGCAGFIGSHLCEVLLEDGHKVYGIDNFDPFYDKQIKVQNMMGFSKNKNFHFLELDLSVLKDYKEFPEQVDFVIHLAAKAGVRPSIENPIAYVKHNVLATQLLLDWMKQSSISKFILASSSSVYGNNKEVPFKEEDNVDFPISNYAYTKKTCELMTHTAHALYDLSALCLRFFTVYGPRQRPDLAIHKFTDKIFNDQPITLYGDGTTARDYTYVDDTIQGILRSINYLNQNSRVFEVINIGNGSPVDLNQLVNSLSIEIGKQPKYKRLPMQPGDVNLTYASIDKARHLLGYKPNITLEKGLNRFVKWYKVNN